MFSAYANFAESSRHRLSHSGGSPISFADRKQTRRRSLAPSPMADFPCDAARQPSPLRAPPKPALSPSPLLADSKPSATLQGSQGTLIADEPAALDTQSTPEAEHHVSVTMSVDPNSFGVLEAPLPRFLPTVSDDVMPSPAGSMVSRFGAQFDMVSS